MAEIERKRTTAATAATKTPADPSTILAEGRIVYVGKCAVCHGEKGEGTIGPNLTDGFWIHGDGKDAAVETVVKDGVADKGMPAWLNSLKPDELKNVVAFVRSLADTNVSGKAPQGTKVQ